MPEQESFNPKQYSSFEDLPAGHQDEFAPVEGGFVSAEAKEKFEEAEKIARIVNLLDREKISASDILKEEALKDDREKTKKEEIEKEIKERIIRDVEDGRDILFFDSKTRKLDPQYEDFVKDEELIRLYVKNAKYVDAEIIKFLPLSLRNDRELMLAFQKKTGDHILQLTSSELRSDKEFVLKMLEENSQNIAGVSNDFLMDDDFLLFAAAKDGEFFAFEEYVPEIKKQDKEFLLKAVSVGYWFYRYFPKAMQNDLDIIYGSMESVLDKTKEAYKEDRKYRLEKGGFSHQEADIEKRKTEELVDKEAGRHAKRELVFFIKNNLSEEVKKKLSNSAHSLNYVINTDSPIL